MLVTLAGCGSGAAMAEPEAWARAALIPTFTPLPPPTATITPLPTPSPTAAYSTPTPDVFEAAGLPVRLEIPAIGVDAPIEHVGRLPTGAMDVPKIPENVAWFDESALPGQRGRPAVLSGHLDSPYGPAVFYKLRFLVPGDELAVTYENGARYVFAVRSKERYIHDQAPMQRIFSENPRRLLNLITCDGAWDRGQANYQQRLVIYTEMKP
jgi:sortase (surface protein transpeptidase)